MLHGSGEYCCAPFFPQNTLRLWICFPVEKSDPRSLPNTTAQFKFRLKFWGCCQSSLLQAPLCIRRRHRNLFLFMTLMLSFHVLSPATCDFLYCYFTVAQRYPLSLSALSAVSLVQPLYSVLFLMCKRYFFFFANPSNKVTSICKEDFLQPKSIKDHCCCGLFKFGWGPLFLLFLLLNKRKLSEHIWVYYFHYFNEQNRIYMLLHLIHDSLSSQSADVQCIMAGVKFILRGFFFIFHFSYS